MLRGRSGLTTVTYGPDDTGFAEVLVRLLTEHRIRVVGEARDGATRVLRLRASRRRARRFGAALMAATGAEYRWTVHPPDQPKERA